MNAKKEKYFFVTDNEEIKEGSLKNTLSKDALEILVVDDENKEFWVKRDKIFESREDAEVFVKDDSKKVFYYVDFYWETMPVHKWGKCESIYENGVYLVDVGIRFREGVFLGEKTRLFETLREAEKFIEEERKSLENSIKKEIQKDSDLIMFLAEHFYKSVGHSPKEELKKKVVQERVELFFLDK